jgi:signal transduction histidine kinase
MIAGKPHPADESLWSLTSLRDLIDILEDELVVVDAEYRVRFANAAMRSRLGEGNTVLMGELCYEVFHHRGKPCGAPMWSCPLKEVLRKGTEVTLIQPEPGGSANRYLKITAYPLRDDSGEVKFVAEQRRDVSAERELETHILRRHHQLLALNRISSAVRGLWDLDAVLEVALDNVLEVLNGAVGGILLLDKASRTLSYRVHRGLSATFVEGMRIRLGEGIAGKVAQTGEPVLEEDLSKSPRAAHHDLVSAEGLKAFVSVPLKSRDRTVGVMNVASQQAARFGADDLSLLSAIGDYLGTAVEQANLYENLSMGRERYRRLLQHALTAQEEERKRIARELHDETSQTLTSLTLNLQALISLAEMKGLADAEFLDKLRTVHSHSIIAGNEIVNLMKELRPTLLDELGLPAAIHRYAKDTLQPRGIDLSAEFAGVDKRFRPEVEVTLFRIAQGAIGNVLEHSDASNVKIRLACTSRDCRLKIEDDGKGFEVGKLTRVDPSGRGTGLFTMKERAKLAGGTCRIESRPGHGTKLSVKIPLAGEGIVEKNQGAGG